MIDIDIAIQREFTTPARVDTVYALLSDTVATLAHYPKLDKLIDLGENGWRWELTPTGLKGISYQVVYSVRYSHNESNKRITWTPLQAKQDNAEISGAFDLSIADGATKVCFSIDGKLCAIPVPKLLASALKPLIKREFEQQMDGFMANLKTALSDG